MEESYLVTDSKGIFPEDLEDRISYLARGGIFVTLKLTEDKEIVDALEKEYDGGSFDESRASESAYEHMIKKYDCDMIWMPYYNSEAKRGGESHSLLTQSGGFCTYFYMPGSGKSDYPVIIICQNIDNVDTDVHEMIHAARHTMDDSSDSDAYKELMAYQCRRYSFFSRSESLLPCHDEIKKDVTGSRKSLKALAKAYKRLEDCFGDKADYALIRLKQREANAIAEMNSRKVIDYFKRASAGFLRFEIMCEKLGL